MRSHISPLDNVLVMGPGPIGLQAAQIVKRIFGAKKIMITGTRKERLDRARAYDLDGYINVREEDLFERVRWNFREMIVNTLSKCEDYML